MLNNDILRRLRYILNVYDSTMAEIFALGGCTVTIDEAASFLKKEEEPGYVECGQPEMDCFLNGLIIYKRGPKEGAPPPVRDPHAIVTNNTVLKKLRIAFELQEDDLLDIMRNAGAEISRHEMSALFRKDGHKHYKDCGDQFMRHFLRGLTLRQYPPGTVAVGTEPKS